MLDSSGKNTGLGSHSLLHGIFVTQGLNPGLLHCRWILYYLSHRESPSESLSAITCCLLYPNTLSILIIVLYYWSDNSYILYLCLDAYLSFQTVFLPFSMLCKFLLVGHNLVKVTVVNRLVSIVLVKCWGWGSVLIWS